MLLEEKQHILVKKKILFSQYHFPSMFPAIFRIVKHALLLKWTLHSQSQQRSIALQQMQLLNKIFVLPPTPSQSHRAHFLFREEGKSFFTCTEGSNHSSKITMHSYIFLSSNYTPNTAIKRDLCKFCQNVYTSIRAPETLL